MSNQTTYAVPQQRFPIAPLVVYNPPGAPLRTISNSASLVTEPSLAPPATDTFYAELSFTT